MLLRTPNQRSGTIVLTNELLIVNAAPTASAHTERIWIGEERVWAKNTLAFSTICWVKDTGTLSTKPQGAILDHARRDSASRRRSRPTVAGAARRRRSRRAAPWRRRARATAPAAWR